MDIELDLTLGLHDSTEIKVLSRSEVFHSSFANMKAWAEDNNDPMKQKDLMYISFILCHEGSNKNGDYFFRDELLNCYKSPVFKAYDWEHDSPIIGVITDAEIVIPEDGDEDQRAYVVCGAVVWKYMFPTEAKLIAKYAMSGELRNSMECWFEDYVYVVGEFGGEQEIYGRKERPELGKYVGKLLGGKPVYRGLKGVLFGGCGCVQNPADEDAIFKSVASKRNPRQLLNLFPDEMEGAIDLNGENTLENTKAEETVVNTVEDSKAELNLDVTLPEVDIKDAQPEEVKPEEEQVPEVKPEVEDVVTDDKVLDELPDCANTDVPEGEGVEDPPAVEASTSEVPEQAEAEVNYCDVESVVDYQMKHNEMQMLPYVIGDVIYNILWSSDIEDKGTAIAEQIDKFSVKIKELASEILAEYKDRGWASMASTKSDLEATIAELNEKLNTLQSTYDALVATLEADKAEKEACALADLRVADLKASGLPLDDKMVSHIYDDLKACSEEQYLSKKEFMLSVRYASVSEKVEAEAVEEEQETENVHSDATPDNTIESTNASVKPVVYNVESEIKSEKNIFKEIAKNLVSSK